MNTRELDILGAISPRMRELQRQREQQVKAATQQFWALQREERERRAKIRGTPAASRDAFLQSLSTLWGFTKRPIEGVRFTNRDTRREAARLHAKMLHARVFHVDPQVYIDLHRHFDRWTTEKVAGQDFVAPKTLEKELEGLETQKLELTERLKTAPEERQRGIRQHLRFLEDEIAQAIGGAEAHGKDYKEAILEAVQWAPFVETLPFDSVFIGYGDQLTTQTQGLVALLEAGVNVDPEDIMDSSLLGHYIDREGEVVTFTEVRLKNGVPWIIPSSLRDVGSQQWNKTLLMGPWVLPTVVASVMDKRTFVLEQPWSKPERQKFRKDRKKLGLQMKKPSPPAFYKVTLQNKVIREQTRKQKGHPRVKWIFSHRFDVRAHERCRICRGELPLDPDLEANLLGRKYKVYKHRPIEAEDARRLFRRSIPQKRPNEWMGILTIQVKEHEKGPEEAPYVPAVRVVPLGS